MPIYEFVCRECGVRFEKIVPLNTETSSCQKCESNNVEKVLSTFAVQTQHYSPCGSESSACRSCPGAGAPGMCSLN
jgi:putative FmdB family regulatory protein